MNIDALQLFGEDQALTATAASTNTIDFGSDRDVGVGEPLAAVVTVDTALAGTSPTFQVSIQTDDNDSFASPTTLVSSQSYSSAAAGTRIVIPVPFTNERYVRLNYTLGGTSPTITVTAFLQPQSMVSKTQDYPDGYTIS